MFYWTLLAVGVTAAAGDLLVYTWAKSNSSLALAAALASWAVSLILFGLMLREDGRSLGGTFVMAAATHTVLILLWDLLIVGSRWSKLEVVGIVLAVAGVMLIETAHSSQSNDQAAGTSPVSAANDIATTR